MCITPILFCIVSFLAFPYPMVALIPQPAQLNITFKYYRIPLQIVTQTNVPYCFTLQTALDRLLSSFKQQHLVRDLPNFFDGNITLIKINISSECNELFSSVYPSENSKEDYNVSISNGTIDISASEVWGALYGLTSVSQMVMSTSNNEKYLPVAKIVDSPRWPFRSYLVDSSRHFIPLQYILRFLKAMATVKMNVFHWHIVDDQSFPYESYTFPGLADKGAYSRSSATYSQQDVKFVIEYARSLGIRVMPEIDSPGHTLSWGKGYPSLLTPCFSRRRPVVDRLGPLNPIKNSTYDFVIALLGEVTKVFPDNALHLGGDEVDFGCWRSNPEIRAFMDKMGFNSSYQKLENYYFENLFAKINQTIKKKLKLYVWQEIFDDGVATNDSVVIHVWKNWEWRRRLEAITRAGKEAIFSACWYLNYIGYGEDWISPYLCDPAVFTNDSNLQQLLKGGGATMWGEYVDHTNLISRSWPRGAVVAERLWSRPEVRDVGDMRIRLANYRCHLLSMGINGEPVTGPGYCDLA